MALDVTRLLQEDKSQVSERASGHWPRLDTGLGAHLMDDTKSAELGIFIQFADRDSRQRQTGL